MAEYIDRETVLDYLAIIPIDLGYREIEDIKRFIKEIPAAHHPGIGACPYDCDNKTSMSYCRTTACINPKYSNFGTAQYSLYSESEMKHVFAPAKPMTNGDRIRAMSDDELSQFLCAWHNAEECHHCVAEQYCEYGHTGMIDWLRQEVKE